MKTFYSFSIEYVIMFDFFGCERIHFLGIGGVSTSLLARYLFSCGVKVTGTDKQMSAVLTALSEAGIPVWTGFLPEKTGKPSAVVYSSAIPPSDPELSYLRSCGVPSFERFDLLGAVSEKFLYRICIAGTHGKTTTTAMISKVLSDSGKKLFSHVGGNCPDLGEFLYTGNDYFVCEACEYRKSFLSLRPDIAVVLNAEMDHPDTYRDLTEVYDTFDLYLQNARKNSVSVLCGDDKYYENRQAFNRPVTFGTGRNCAFRITNERETGGRYGCDIEYRGKSLYSFDLSVIGRYNLYNAAACAAVCAILKIDPLVVNRSLSLFGGVKRRFEYKGLYLGAEVYSDYAHHPTEIAACLVAGRKIQKEGKLWAVFQPHTFSRTKALAEDFCSALKNCDGLILLKEYGARETEKNGMSGKRLFDLLRNEEKYYCDSIIDVAALLTEKTAPNDIIIVLGAGNIDVLCDLLVPPTI